MHCFKVLGRIAGLVKSRCHILLALVMAGAGSVAIAQQADYSYSLRIVHANAPFFTQESDIETMQPGDKAWLRLEVASVGGVSHGAVQLVGPLPAPLLVGRAVDSSSSCLFYTYGSQEGQTQFSMGFIQWDNQPSCVMYVPIVWPANVPCPVPRTLTINASKDDANNPIVASDSVRCGVIDPSSVQAVPTTTSFALTLLIAMMAAVGIYMRRRL